jgi:DNA-directed RNA polymerase subunit N (RpoN/RPB10)
MIEIKCAACGKVIHTVDNNYSGSVYASFTHECSYWCFSRIPFSHNETDKETAKFKSELVVKLMTAINDALKSI